MGIEIERKFLLSELPAEAAEHAQAREIQQGYFSTSDGRELRLRRKGELHYICEKTGTGLSRKEVELAITPSLFELLWPSTAGHRVEKTRHTLRQGPLNYEFDVFFGDLQGLVFLEVEFDTEEEARAFQAPDYVIRDVTEDERYLNTNLAKHGRPE